MSFCTNLGKGLKWYLQCSFSQNPLLTSCPVFNSGFPGLSPFFTAVYISAFLTQVNSDGQIGTDYNQQENIYHSHLWVFIPVWKIFTHPGAARTLPKRSSSQVSFKAEMLLSCFFPFWFYWIDPLNITRSLRFSTVTRIHQCFVHWEERKRFSNSHCCKCPSLIVTQAWRTIVTEGNCHPCVLGPWGWGGVARFYSWML